MQTDVRPTDVAQPGDNELAATYLNRAKGRNPSIGVTRKWNHEDIRRAYIAGRRDERQDPR